MAISAEHRSKFETLQRQWWRLHLSEKICCRAFSSCFNDFGLSRPGFEHPIIHMRGERSNWLRHCMGWYSNWKVFALIVFEVMKLFSRPVGMNIKHIGTSIWKCYKRNVKLYVVSLNVISWQILKWSIFYLWWCWWFFLFYEISPCFSSHRVRHYT